MIKGVIFDLDGLMFDTEPMWTTFWRPALASLGLPYREELPDAFRGTAGESSREVLRSFYGEQVDADAIMDRFFGCAKEAFAQPVPKKPGLDELTAWLYEEKIPMAVASSSEREVIERHLLNAHLEQYFPVILSGHEVACSKPDPEIFLRAARELHVKPKECLVLEDSHNGVRAGYRGGFLTVMVPDLLPVTDEMRGIASAICGDLHEVLKLMKAGKLG
ncbi:MAG: HAD family phosphatase [Lachnospiraceae bacterium]|nr:HAD family phosphatase [Lachnospiraceae bacterium]